jgi:predicted secreted protein
MAGSNAISSVGVHVYYQDKTTLVFTELEEVTSLSGLGGTKDTIEVTSFSSTGGYKEYIDGFKDGGEVSLEMNYTTETYKLLNEMYNATGANGRFKFRVSFPDTAGTKLDFNVIVTAAPVQASVGDKVMSSCTLKVTGEIVRSDNL